MEFGEGTDHLKKRQLHAYSQQKVLEGSIDKDMTRTVDNYLETLFLVTPFHCFIPNQLLFYCHKIIIILAEITCPDLANPVEGIVEIQGNTPGASAVYSCNRGISLIGTSRRICGTDGTWSGEPPTCEGKLRILRRCSTSFR